MNLSDLARNSHMLRGALSKKGYMRWWHSFTGTQPETGETRTFYIEFYIINPALGGTRPILGQHPYFKKRGAKPSYVMVKAGVFPDQEGNGGRQLHAFYPISALQATGSPLIMQLEDANAGKCFYSEDKLTGYVEASPREARRRSHMTDAGRMEWDVKVHKAVSCRGAWGGRFLQALNALDSYWHGEGIRCFFQGSVTLDGVAYEVEPETSYGYADKHWGRSFNNPWFQFACGNLTSKRSHRQLRPSALAMNCLRPRFLRFSLRRRLVLQLTYMGEDFEFSRCKWDTKETSKRFVWHILAQNKKTVIKISGSCTKAEMQNLLYESPDGNLSRLPLLAGCGGIGTIQLYRKDSGGRELLDTLAMDNALCVYRAEEAEVH